MMHENVRPNSADTITRISRIAVAATLIAAGLFAAPAYAAKGDCSQPSTSGVKPTTTDCLFILKAAVQSATCDPTCICAPKGTLPISATDALICLKGAVGQPVTLNCPCDDVTTTSTTTSTTISSGVKGAIPIQGRMNSNAMLGLPAATAACEENFPGSHFCTYAELQTSEGAKLAGLEDIHGTAVTSFWAIDASQGVTRQCGQSLSASAPLWTYNTAHLGVGGDFVPLENDGSLGTLVVGGGSNRNCSDSKLIGCCR